MRGPNATTAAIAAAQLLQINAVSDTSLLLASSSVPLPATFEQYTAIVASAPMAKTLCAWELDNISKHGGLLHFVHFNSFLEHLPQTGCLKTSESNWGMPKERFSQHICNLLLFDQAPCKLTRPFPAFTYCLDLIYS